MSTALLMNRAGVPFLATLPVAFLVPALVGVALERTLYRRLYGASPLDQVLFTIGLVFMAMPIANYLLGDQPQQIHLPAWLQGRVEFGGVGIGVYRLFLIVVCGAIAAALQIFLVGTRFGARLRAAVDDRARRLRARHQRRSPVRDHLRGRQRARRASAARSRPMSSAASIRRFPLKFMVTFLIVVAIGGSNGILGALVGALLLGVLDVAGKYYVPLDRRLHHLLRDGGHADRAPAGPVRRGDGR